MLEGKTRLVVTATKVGHKTYDRFLIHVPSKIARDSQFPFGAGEVLNIEVDLKNKAIVLSKAIAPRVAPRKRKRG